MPPLLLVLLGGATGALTRYGAVLLIKPHSPDFPAGTLAVNLVGCLLIGALAGVLGPRAVITDKAWLFLAVGVLGGFTTFSSFGIETITMLRDQRLLAAAAYVLASNVGGLALTWLGWSLASRA